ncbi:hypothetical protein [Pseudoalteromonas sp. MB47]|uniref:hypothetical protein n=1 Tax=Pseudoalteromonas sp. MB47 TaxID=2588452 RepID=UPI00140D183D|nr:hypothetical protein [Pseudoalteromonas sp. MB47]NHH89688.1 hypothetical protein [Pseudoalteromonas sp. MB47]
MKVKLLLLGMILLLSCSTAKSALYVNSESCTVKLNNTEKKLGLITPCSLVKVHDNLLNFKKYGETEVYIISGAPSPLDKLSRWSVTKEDNCSLEYQAVIVNNETLSLLKVKDKTLVCPNLGLDEKVYRQFLSD